MNLTNKKRKKAATAGALLLAVMLTMSACGANANNPSSSGNPNNSESGSPVDQLPDNNGVQEPGAPSNDDDNDNNSSTDNNGIGESAPISAEGTYTGLIDSNSLEITTDSGAGAYRIPEELRSVVDELPADAKVKFEYTEKAIEGDTDVKQLWLTKIEAVQ
ncbi:hypothetical protein D3P07_04195 [Paenibacillus sp. 1011MAR3C5]|uniref:hypothetical protein n=1 Tax=Paenibacillus sp. 1011MAR3C5 TaxID=1675787 RepID=UPI000E6D2EC3|nr:hypothetical protein [Paenibacillus sp. 1011MAR3C5]RJE91264.1 hypothetical protein D3P07_04195 [Paenibacillus sp. 1011MAR3C5]